jgi:cell cycle sensor histidine kinase DivJ
LAPIRSANLRKLSGPWPSSASEWITRLAQSGSARAAVDIARRETFLPPRLVLAAGVLLAAPPWIVAYGAPSFADSAIFALAQLPLLSIATLLRRDDLRLARAISASGWVAVAAALVMAGQGAVATQLLAVALIEATLALDFTLLAPITVACAGVFAFDAFTTVAEAPRSAIGAALVALPLLGYVAMLAAGAMKVERVRSRAWDRDLHDLRLLGEATEDLVLRFDEGGALAATIGKGHEAYGLETRELMGRGFFQRVHVGDRPAFLKLVSDAIAAGAPVTATLRLRVGSSQNESGGFVEPVFNFFEARSRLVETAENGAEGGRRSLVCTLRDVTTERRAEETLAAARRESEQAAAGKTRFLAIVSHELRTPLNAIIGFSEMLASDQLAPADPAKRREYAEIIRNSGHHLLAVVNTILDMSKIEAGAMQLSPEPFALPELVEQCLVMMQIKAEQGDVALTADYAAGLDEIVGDKRACKQIVINLLSNAVKFTPPRGRVKLRIYPDGNFLALSVLDNGVGIAPSDLGRLGDPFFQAGSCHDRAHEGAGLGLSVVRGLVGLHGGAITVESAPQSGTCVTVRLPLDCRVQQNRASALAKIETIARRGALGQGDDLDRREDLDIREETVKKIA